MNATTQLIWNGCDGYKEVQKLNQDDSCEQLDDGTFKLYHRSESFTSFPAVEISLDDVPADEDGEPDFDGLFVTDCGKIYRAA
jgi:hypothetical protein